jgi:hypothetical protein
MYIKITKQKARALYNKGQDLYFTTNLRPWQKGPNYGPFNAAQGPSFDLVCNWFKALYCDQKNGHVITYLQKIKE